QSNSFDFETVDFSREKISKFLPGLQSKSSTNLSPFISIRFPSGKNIPFTSLDYTSLINFNRISSFDKYGEYLSDKRPVTFSLWLTENKEKIALELYNYLKANYLTKEEDIEVLTRETPRYLVFSFKEGDKFKFPGEYESFRELYLLVKKAQSSNVQQGEEQTVCLGCGEPKPTLVNLKDLKFFDFFSVDQPMFRLGFQKNSLQAMVCSDCEKLIRKGYEVFNNILKFEAYKLKISEKERQVVFHSILPLSEDTRRLRSFVDALNNYREDFYKSEQISTRKKLEELAATLDSLTQSKKSVIIRRIKRIKKREEYLKKSGMLQSTMQISEIDLLKEAAKRKTGLMDFFYREESYPGGKKKVVKDVIYGDKQQIVQIVKWLQETQEEFKERIYFNLKILVNIFGEKMGRLIFQSLFTGKKISERDFYHAAYNKLWKLFRKYQISKENLKEEEQFYLRHGHNTIHFTLALLQKANILR
ncbi:MAG: hypothetical protein ACTSP3_05760, partial [Candidatus Heimdallarchaeaceae archaeon]